LDDLAKKKTKFGVTLEYCLKSGNENPNSEIGMYAGDAECYSIFAPVFDAAMKHYHGTVEHKPDWTIPQLNIPKEAPVDSFKSSRIRVARNLGNYPFPSAMTKDQRLDVEKQVVGVLLQKFGGKYYTIADIEHNPELVKKDLKGVPTFDNADHFLGSAGTYNDWPFGRGIYVSDDRKIVVWVNEEDHMRVQSFENGFALQAAFARLASVLNELEKHVQIAKSEKFGYINSCPTNCGTGMRISVHAKFKNLQNNLDELKKICKERGLAVRPQGGESSTFKEGEYVDISNKVRLGIGESKLVSNVHQGILDLLELDRKTSK